MCGGLAAPAILGAAMVLMTTIGETVVRGSDAIASSLPMISPLASLFYVSALVDWWASTMALGAAMIWPSDLIRQCQSPKTPATEMVSPW